MGKAVAMILTCVVVSLMMGIILILFRKRLNHIEEERWGGKKMIER